MRKREREQPQIEPFAARVAVPIAVDDSDGPWRASHDSPPKQLLVRANNDQLTRYGASRGEDHEQLAPSLSENDSLAEDVELPSELNPLRSAADILDQSQVVLAAADVPVEPAAARADHRPAALRRG